MLQKMHMSCVILLLIGTYSLFCSFERQKIIGTYRKTTKELLQEHKELQDENKKLRKEVKKWKEVLRLETQGPADILSKRCYDQMVLINMVSVGIISSGCLLLYLCA